MTPKIFILCKQLKTKEFSKKEMPNWKWRFKSTTIFPSAENKIEQF